MKPYLNVESFGEYIRLSLPGDCESPEASNMLHNLAWIAGHNFSETVRGGETVSEIFIRREAFCRAVYAYRSPARFTSKNANKNAPVSFRCVSQRSSALAGNAARFAGAYTVGNTSESGCNVSGLERWAETVAENKSLFDKAEA